MGSLFSNLFSKNDDDAINIRNKSKSKYGESNIYNKKVESTCISCKFGDEHSNCALSVLDYPREGEIFFNAEVFFSMYKYNNNNRNKLCKSCKCLYQKIRQPIREYEYNYPFFKQRCISFHVDCEMLNHISK